MEIKSLVSISHDRLFEAFSRAFADYELQLNREQLKTMLVRRGFVPELSFGAFEGDDIVAFTFNGIGMFNSIKTAYDTGTATVKEYRGKGLASQIFEHSIPFLRKKKVGQYLLEVLQHNTNAVSVYRKLGFEVSREFNYFRNEKKNVKPKTIDPGNSYLIRQTDLAICRSMSCHWDFQPSWQNSFDAIGRKPDDFVMLAAFDTIKPVGYCIAEPASGDITQIAVGRQLRRKGIGSLLLTEALKYISSDSVKLINADLKCSSVTGFIESAGMPVTGKQFEMIKKL